MSTVESISAQAFADEKTVVQALRAELKDIPALEIKIMPRALEWTRKIRAQKVGKGVEALLSTYGLNTEEGVALMGMAEALLRIPDARTADALIHDTFEGRQWQRYLGDSDAFWVNASSWGLLLTGKVIEADRNPLGKMVTRLGEPVIREALKQAMRFLGHQFVLGETIPKALENAKAAHQQGYRLSYDILGEGARTDAQAQGYVASYIDGIAKIAARLDAKVPLFARDSISVKLSALHPRYTLLKRERVMKELLPRLKQILAHAMRAGLVVSIDAEENTRLDIELLLFEALLEDQTFAGWNGIGFVVQAYNKRAWHVIGRLAELAAKHGRVIPLRLVKGAYWDSEIKAAQLAGLPDYPVFTRKEHTDLSYLACAERMFANIACFYPQFATHNARSMASVLALAEKHGVDRDSYEFQRLHGMGEALHDQILPVAASRIYAPVGEHKDLLAYLIRRMLENGANTSFVHLLMDEDKSEEEILADPLASLPGDTALPLPEAIYGVHRKNSRGYDLGNLTQLHALEKSRDSWAKTRWHAEPLVVAPVAFAEKQLCYSPADREEIIGSCRNIKPEELAAVLGVAKNEQPLSARVAALRKAADRIEAHADELISLCQREAGKTLADAIAEIREAADFCRYYAAETERLFAPALLDGPTGESNRLQLHPRGIFACISPWNFPLAIFIGQVAAAYVTGNAVIAKPAEQTPLIAWRAVQLLHEAGIAPQALQLVLGDGAVGAALVKQAAVGGVVFTGSVGTARRINRTLADKDRPIAPLIAETGGLNAMVVDSSALLEQAIDDILLSAFGSTGQRCSALRVLYVQEDIADALLSMLRGAMAELQLGAPSDFSVDLGPVIDEDARQMLAKHIARMKAEATLIAETPLPDALEKCGFYVAPHAFDVRDIEQIGGEVFGPVLHVVRFRAKDLPLLPERINAQGYGLTFGIHSRVQDHIDLLSGAVSAGNCYVNRSMIGATVGVQPFGGEGLSGTGPKAGGPHYLLRFVTERTVTINTAALGGNLSLLAG